MWGEEKEVQQDTLESELMWLADGLGNRSESQERNQGLLKIALFRIPDDFSC